MNAEYLWWFLILVAVGVGVVTYLALGPIPEIPAATPGESAAAADDDQSSPVSTTEPGPDEPSSTSETP
jgi:hypothetical protein